MSKNIPNLVAVPQGIYNLHTDRFFDLKEIRAKQVFDPYAKWPFWHQERATSGAIRVRLTCFVHGSIALSVLFKIGFYGFNAFCLYT